MTAETHSPIQQRNTKQDRPLSASHYLGPERSGTLERVIAG